MGGDEYFRKRLREELGKATFYDYLSGFLNRRIFDDRLNMAIHQANRSKNRVAVMMLDGKEFNTPITQPEKNS